ncbi:MAG: hypothetical protein R3B70_25375 [Polyangiaceae bacterium]
MPVFWRIRGEQWAALMGDRLEAFADRAVPFLRGEAPEVVEDASDDEVRELALRAAKRGVSLGFEDAYCLQQLVLFVAWYGEELFDAPWARRVLEQPSTPELTKVARLEDYLLTRWEGAR